MEIVGLSPTPGFLAVSELQLVSSEDGMHPFIPGPVLGPSLRLDGMLQAAPPSLFRSSEHSSLTPFLPSPFSKCAGCFPHKLPAMAA